MSEHITHVGLDVHKHSTAVAAASQGQRTRFLGTVGPDINERLKALDHFGTTESLKVVYEAGACGYGWVRALREHGYACDVIAPAKIARRPRRSGQGRPARCTASGGAVLSRHTDASLGIG